MAFTLGAAASSTPAFGGFGAAASSAGAASTGGFGGFGAAASSAGAASTGGFGGFGAAASSAGAASTGGFGGFGAAASSAGAASTGGFGGFGAAASSAGAAATKPAFGGFGAAASSAGAASTGGFGGFGAAASSGAATKPAFGGFGAAASSAGAAAAKPAFGGFGAAASSGGAASMGGFGGFGAASGSGFGAATQGFGGFGKAASSMGSTASGAAAGHTGEAYARFRREAQRWDFASANVRRPPSDGLESALVKALEVALAQNQRPANSAGNHITAQRLELLGFGVARNAAVAGMPATVGFGQPMSGAGFGGAAGMGTVGNRSRYHGLDDHDEDNQVFDWPIRPNAATEYRHIFYQPISRKECQERNALNGHPAVHDEAHTPNDLRPVDVDDHMWQQALLNKPQNPEYEFQLQQVVGYRGLYARMQARQRRVQEMQNALTGVEQRISRMGDHHARHTQEAREHRHRQQEISHQMLRVMGKVERLHSERLRLPWTAAEDDLEARLSLLTKQLQHPAHPVNALTHLGPRVRLADASLPAERDTGVAASAYTLNDEDKRAIAAVLQEQRKGLEFLRNTLQTDVRHVQLMLEHVSPGGSSTVAYARGSTVQSMLSHGGSGAAPGAAGVDPAFGTDGGLIDPLRGGGHPMSGLGLPTGPGAASVGPGGGPSPQMWGFGGAPGMGVMQQPLPGMGGANMYGAYGTYGAAPGGMGMVGMPMGMPYGAPMGMQAASPFVNAQMGAARMGY